MSTDERADMFVWMTPYVHDSCYKSYCTQPSPGSANDTRWPRAELWLLADAIVRLVNVSILKHLQARLFLSCLLVILGNTLNCRSTAQVSQALYSVLEVSMSRLGVTTGSSAFGM